MRKRRFQNNDPKWITAKFPSKCTCCDRNIQTGEKAFWFPVGKYVFCDLDPCGVKQHKTFTAAVQDEDNYNSPNQRF